jgi:hypothetical protein
MIRDLIGWDGAAVLAATQILLQLELPIRHGRHDVVAEVVKRGHRALDELDVLDVLREGLRRSGQVPVVDLPDGSSRRSRHGVGSKRSRRTLASRTAPTVPERFDYRIPG